MVLGPLDRRNLKTRCQACARRRIKCVGSRPCFYCNKRKIQCLPQASNNCANLVFVNTRSDLVADPSPAPGSEEDIALARFFTVFMERNDFAGEHLDTSGIISSFQASPSLYHATLAIGSLDLRTTSSSLKDRRAITASALLSYQTAIKSFKSDMQHSDVRRSHAALWTTFFLGLFELMYDVTGQGWVKHILYGTSSILQF
ncbi:uncharacterized protein LY89DRAFT_728376 [Mollisia scopiformis]|uniref:Zn(2)-C6 fungal-type domain-containing protein n=1 Tax=Mollisia scopiformis TaxID=149040 RepID=A0A194XTK5_MOLSC|nr:uncharacterized protein LY89DRAFT_728376 [Mollisia scopiformis]KUJ23650.1 hypothetical protein LY89DRAFT_728376 [Mollisia scopiformis]